MDLYSAIDNDTVTDKNCKAYKSSLSKIVDLFTKGSSYRKSVIDNECSFSKLVEEANKEDSLKTLLCLFYLRSIRNIGQGERVIFRTGLKTFFDCNINKLYPKVIKNILNLIPDYGRWDDLIYFVFSENKLIKQFAFDIIKEQLEKDINSKGNISLLAKWMPSVNTTSPTARYQAVRLAKMLKMNCAEYRKTLSSLRKRLNLIEHKLTTKTYDFDYGLVPGRAFLKYQEAFMYKDSERYNAFLKEVENDKRMIKASTIYPYEIVRRYISDSEVNKNNSKLIKSLNVFWSQLPNHLSENNNKCIVIGDHSGSMFDAYNCISPIDIAISLEIYISERLSNPAFKNKFIAFSEYPELISFDKNDSFIDKVEKVLHWPGQMNTTNLEKTFELIINTAKEYHLSQDDMPETIIIVSDMQFDAFINFQTNTSIRAIKKMFKQAGYNFPKLVYWNVANYNFDNSPALANEENVITDGGASPSVLKMVFEDIENLNPINFMNKVFELECFNPVKKAYNLD